MQKQSGRYQAWPWTTFTINMTTTRHGVLKLMRKWLWYCYNKRKCSQDAQCYSIIQVARQTNLYPGRYFQSLTPYYPPRLAWSPGNNKCCICLCEWYASFTYMQANSVWLGRLGITHTTHPKFLKLFHQRTLMRPFGRPLQSRQAPSSASSHAGAGSQFRSGSCLVRSEIEPVLWATASRVLPEVLWVATRSWRPLRCSGVSGVTLPGVVYSKRELIPRSPRPSVSLPLRASLHP